MTSCWKKASFFLICNILWITPFHCQYIPGSFLVQISSPCDEGCRTEVQQLLTAEGQKVCLLSNQATIEIGTFFFEKVNCSFEEEEDDDIVEVIDFENNDSIGETTEASSIRYSREKSEEDGMNDIVTMPPSIKKTAETTELIRKTFNHEMKNQDLELLRQILSTEAIESPAAIPVGQPFVEDIVDSDENTPSFSIPTESAIIGAFASAGITVILVEQEPIIMAISDSEKSSSFEKRSGWHPDINNSNINSEGSENQSDSNELISVCILEDEAPKVGTSLWNIDIVDGGGKDDERTCVSCSNRGAGVNIWIFDSGCEPSNGGECYGYYEDVEDGGGCSDILGHGSHVGGIATDYTYMSEDYGLEGFGVATEASRSCIKILDDTGFGSSANIVAGIDYVLKNRQRDSKGDVINLSVSGPISFIVNNALKAAAGEGIYFSVAPGNDFSNACEISPASANGSGIYTVEAHDENNIRADFSNFGQFGVDCTDISAPGSSILSLGGVKSGTSMASPHVAGAIAILLSNDVDVSLNSLTSGGVRVKLKPGDPSLIIQKRSLGLVCSQNV